MDIGSIFILKWKVFLEDASISLLITVNQSIQLDTKLWLLDLAF